VAPPGFKFQVGFISLYFIAPFFLFFRGLRPPPQNAEGFFFFFRFPSAAFSGFTAVSRKSNFSPVLRPQCASERLSSSSPPSTGFRFKRVGRRWGVPPYDCFLSLATSFYGGCCPPSMSSLSPLLPQKSWNDAADPVKEKTTPPSAPPAIFSLLLPSGSFLFSEAPISPLWRVPTSLERFRCL